METPNAGFDVVGVVQEGIASLSCKSESALSPVPDDTEQAPSKLRMRDSLRTRDKGLVPPCPRMQRGIPRCLRLLGDGGGVRYCVLGNGGKLP